MQDYRVQLEIYQGPLDLLLYLIRREEVDIYDIPIARITEQYVQYVELLRDIDPNAVGDFLVLAATLMEIKSRMLLPRAPAEEEDEEFIDPRLDLVRQLLEYKKFKDAAAHLHEAAHLRSLRHARIPADQRTDHVDVELDELQIWDLLTAFNKLMSSVGRSVTGHEVFFDDTPISLHAADIQDRLQREGGSLPFEQLFEGRSKSEMIGLFLALLELVRQRRIRAEQEAPLATIFVHLVDATPITEASLADAAGEAELEEEDEEDTGFGGGDVVAVEEEIDDDRDDEYARMIDEVEADVPVELEHHKSPASQDAQATKMDTEETDPA
jgi:segregation and condensation protein A